MKILRKILALILITLIIFTLTNITQVNILASSNSTFNNEKITNVAVIIHRLDDPYMMRLRESLENIEKDNQKNVKFTFFDAKNNISIQNEILDSALKSRYDLFILNLANKKENIVSDILFKFKEQNIPVILMNIPEEVVAKVSKLYDKAIFVQPDSKNAGTAQGKIIVNLWNNNKNAIDRNGDEILQYVLLEGKVDDPQAIDRSKYVISTINNSGIKTQQFAMIDAGWLKDLARDSINNLFLTFNGRIEAIISNNDAMAIGAIEALQKYGYNNGDNSKNIEVVGIDGLPEAKTLIDKGLMAGTIIQNPNIAAEMFYTIGMNLVHNINPTENTNYKTINGEIIIPYPYDTYTGN